MNCKTCKVFPWTNNARIVFCRVHDKAPKVRALLQSAIDHWPEAFNGDDINGSDAVDWLVEFVHKAKKIVGAS